MSTTNGSTKVAVFIGNTLLDFVEVPNVFKVLTENELLSLIQKYFNYPVGIELETV